MQTSGMQCFICGMQMRYFGLQQLNLFCMWFAGLKGEVCRPYFWFAGGVQTIFLARRWFADDIFDSQVVCRRPVNWHDLDFRDPESVLSLNTINI